MRISRKKLKRRKKEKNFKENKISKPFAAIYPVMRLPKRHQIFIHH